MSVYLLCVCVCEAKKSKAWSWCVRCQREVSECCPCLASRRPSHSVRMLVTVVMWLPASWLLLTEKAFLIPHTCTLLGHTLSQQLRFERHRGGRKHPQLRLEKKYLRGSFRERGTKMQTIKGRFVEAEEHWCRCVFLLLTHLLPSFKWLWCH